MPLSALGKIECNTVHGIKLATGYCDLFSRTICLMTACYLSWQRGFRTFHSHLTANVRGSLWVVGGRQSEHRWCTNHELDRTRLHRSECESSKSSVSVFRGQSGQMSIFSLGNHHSKNRKKR